MRLCLQYNGCRGLCYLRVFIPSSSLLLFRLTLNFTADNSLYLVRRLASHLNPCLITMTGGHVGMVFGWLIPSLFVFSVAASMAEMASSMP